MAIPSSAPRLLLTITLTLCAVLGGASRGVAQEFDEEPIFKPVIEPTPTKKPQAAPAVFSFARFEPNLRLMCEQLEADGRRERFVAVAVAETDKKDQSCISCRALWRAVLGGCAKLGPRATPTPKPKKGSPTPTESTEGGDEGAEKGEGGDDASAEGPKPTPLAPTATPSPAPKARTPSAAAVDIASRISIAAYAVDPGDGGVRPAFANLVTVVMSTKDLTPAEREYFDNLFTYLMASWEGREEADGVVQETPVVNVDEFFEE